jgi:hypothetical protein
MSQTTPLHQAVVDNNEKDVIECLKNNDVNSVDEVFFL